MRSYLLPRLAAGIAFVLVSAMTLAASAAPLAGTSSAAGWRIVATLGPPGGGSQVMSVAAVSATDAWLAWR